IKAFKASIAGMAGADACSLVSFTLITELRNSFLFFRVLNSVFLAFLNAFIDKGDYLNNLYVNKTRTAAEQKRLNEILRAQVISGLKASEGLAKLLIASGIML
ncbi:hypothetical protein AB9D18_09645, partial [Escherichia coli]